MQHSESRPSFAVLPRADIESSSNNSSALWFALALTVVGFALALTFSLSQSIVTSWVFVD